MNTPIARLFTIVLLLFAALIAFTSRWSVFDAQALRDNPKNRRGLIEELQVKRGTIRAVDGTLLARSEPAGAGTYRRRYTEAARLLPQVIGFSESGDAAKARELAARFRSKFPQSLLMPAVDAAAPP